MAKPLPTIPAINPICKKTDRAALVLPQCNTAAMTVRLNQVAAIVVIDRAGPRRSNPGKVPDTITPIPLPAPSAALNPVENIRQFMRDNQRSNRIFGSVRYLSHFRFQATAR